MKDVAGVWTDTMELRDSATSSEGARLDDADECFISSLALYGVRGAAGVEDV